MPTGTPSLGFQLRGDRSCLCYNMHYPKTSAQHCECECHLDQMDKRFQNPVKLTLRQRKTQQLTLQGKRN